MESLSFPDPDDVSPVGDLDAQRYRLLIRQAEYADFLKDVGLTARALKHCMPSLPPGYDVTISRPIVYAVPANTEHVTPGLQREVIGLTFIVQKYVEGNLISKQMLKEPVAEMYNGGMAFPIDRGADYTDHDASIVSGMVRELRDKAASGELSALSPDCTDIRGW